MTTDRCAPDDRRRPFVLITLLLAGAAGFAWIATEVFTSAASGLDERVGSLIQQYSTPPMTSAMKAITVLGSAGVAPALVLLALAAIRRPAWRVFAVPVLVASSGAGLLDQLLKHLLPRARPMPLFGIPPSGLSSFPSGHALFALSLYGTLAWLVAARLTCARGRACVWAGATVLVLAIGLSRVYLGLHHATDVIAGFAAGIGWVSAVLIAADRGWLPGMGTPAAADDFDRTPVPRQ